MAAAALAAGVAEEVMVSTVYPVVVMGVMVEVVVGATPVDLVAMVVGVVVVVMVAQEASAVAVVLVAVVDLVVVVEAEGRGASAPAVVVALALEVSEAAMEQVMEEMLPGLEGPFLSIQGH